MDKPLFGEKMAVLVANGFNEKDLVDMQRMAQSLGAEMRIVSMNGGLVNSWNGEGWGLNFAADKVLNEALAVDFSILVIPGGQKSAEKLKLTAHTRRFIGGFVDTGKSVVVMGEALGLLAFSDKLTGRTVAGSDSMKDISVEAGATWCAEPFCVDMNLMTTDNLSESSQILSDIQDFLVAPQVLDKAA